MASSKIVSYDLCAPGKDYKDLIDFIKSYSVWARVTESTWIIGTDETCVSLRDKLKQYTDSNDRLFVAALTEEAAWYNVKCDTDYLRNNL
ncbi:CRISPR-associated protein Cas2 [Clostridium sp. AWRP]|uniref:CRISPR-associated protein Cas2 n=1 Tax=Clostridium sp. AWRP TaxID=2212991 RepID=UPI000FD8790A|nr:CRISPR-associated protein Cas2 [Clostridium sp. AWRP]AZV56046.1 CRISPR-associated protein Cas2 [Clostridium sp. AWRP]